MLLRIVACSGFPAEVSGLVLARVPREGAKLLPHANVPLGELASHLGARVGFQCTGVGRWLRLGAVRKETVDLRRAPQLTYRGTPAVAS